MVNNFFITRFSLTGYSCAYCDLFNELKAFVISEWQNKNVEIRISCSHYVALYFDIKKCNNPTLFMVKYEGPQ
jgi:hypothetical protein